MKFNWSKFADILTKISLIIVACCGGTWSVIWLCYIWATYCSKHFGSDLGFAIFMLTIFVPIIIAIAFFSSFEKIDEQPK